MAVWLGISRCHEGLHGLQLHSLWRTPTAAVSHDSPWLPWPAAALPMENPYCSCARPPGGQRAAAGRTSAASSLAPLTDQVALLTTDSLSAFARFYKAARGEQGPSWWGGSLYCGTWTVEGHTVRSDQGRHGWAVVHVVRHGLEQQQLSPGWSRCSARPGCGWPRPGRAAGADSHGVGMSVDTCTRLLRADWRP